MSGAHKAAKEYTMHEKINTLVASLEAPPHWTPGHTDSILFLIGWWPIEEDEWLEDLLANHQASVRAWMMQVTGRDQPWKRSGQLRGELGIAAYEAAARIGEPPKGQAYVEYSSRFAAQALRSLAGMIDMAVK